MRNALRARIALLVALALATPAVGELCTIDDVPAATLLIPYFEVEPEKKGKVNTVVSIQNTSFEATVAHVVLWTDWAVPTLAFDVFLTGYDIVQIDLRELFINGTLPRTAHATNDPDDTISPHGGEFSDNPFWDSNPDNPDASLFEGCDLVLPPSAVSRSDRARLAAGHTGRDTGRGCVGADHGDGVARGYITIDNVTDCSSLLPGEDGYFGLDGVASNVNQLRGEFYITEKAGRGAAAGPAVAIEADDGFAGTSTGYTFYARYSDGSTSDRREPLATTWSVRQPTKLPFGRKQRSLTTDLLIWRDTKSDILGGGFACGVRLPPWLPLDENRVVAFDGQSRVAEPCGETVDPVQGPVNPTCAPLATQRLRLGRGELESLSDSEWIFLDLNHSALSTNPLIGDLAQSYLTTVLSVGRMRGTQIASALSSACQTISRRKSR